MFKKITINKIIVLALLLLVLLGATFFINNKKNSQYVAGNDITISDDTINILEEKTKWTERIKEVGANVAFVEFKNKFSTMRYDQQHSIAHLFGEILYKSEGIKGLVICDDTFGFGCFHGFFSAALDDRGPKVLKDLDKVCVDKYGVGGSGCQHGLGHGLLEYYGHDYKGLVKSLNECDKTTFYIKKFGCTSGVFMEYDIPISLAVKNLNLNSRELDPKNPYYPCTDVSDRFKESCYFSLGQWWKSLNNSDYAASGRMCSKIDDVVNRESCYLGIGYVVAPSFQNDVNKSVNACKKISNKEGEMLCVAGVEWQIYANPDTRKNTKSACGTLPTELYKQCLLKADLVGSHGQIFDNL